MTYATVIIQAWPRVMTREQALSYCSTTTTRLPAPAYRDGKAPRWVREQLDRWIDERVGRATEPASADEWADVQP